MGRMPSGGNAMPVYKKKLQGKYALTVQKLRRDKAVKGLIFSLKL